jgi:hypothetical protein
VTIEKRKKERKNEQFWVKRANKTKIEESEDWWKKKCKKKKWKKEKKMEIKNQKYAFEFLCLKLWVNNNSLCSHTLSDQDLCEW